MSVGTLFKRKILSKLLNDATELFLEWRRGESPRRHNRNLKGGQKVEE